MAQTLANLSDKFNSYYRYINNYPISVIGNYFSTMSSYQYTEQYKTITIYGEM